MTKHDETNANLMPSTLPNPGSARLTGVPATTETNAVTICFVAVSSNAIVVMLESGKLGYDGGEQRWRINSASRGIDFGVRGTT